MKGLGCWMRESGMRRRWRMSLRRSRYSPRHRRWILRQRVRLLGIVPLRMLKGRVGYVSLVQKTVCSYSTYPFLPLTFRVNPALALFCIYCFSPAVWDLDLYPSCMRLTLLLGRLISPCRCRGTMKFVHVHCLNSWRYASPNRRSVYQCDQCGYRYHFNRTHYAAIASSIYTRVQSPY